MVRERIRRKIVEKLQSVQSVGLCSFLTIMAYEKEQNRSHRFILRKINIEDIRNLPHCHMLLRVYHVFNKTTQQKKHS